MIKKKRGKKKWKKKKESNTKESIKEWKKRGWGKFSHWNKKKWESAWVCDIQQPVHPWCHCFEEHNTLWFNSLSLVWALSLFKKNTPSTPFHISSTCLQSWAECRSQSPVYWTAGNGEFLSKELVHEMSMEKIIYCSAFASKQVGWLTANPI